MAKKQKAKIEKERKIIEGYTRKENKEQGNQTDETLSKKQNKEKMQRRGELAWELLAKMDIVKLVQQWGKRMRFTERLKNLKPLRMLVAAWRVWEDSNTAIREEGVHIRDGEEVKDKQATEDKELGE